VGRKTVTMTVPAPEFPPTKCALLLARRRSGKPEKLTRVVVCAARSGAIAKAITASICAALLTSRAAGREGWVWRGRSRRGGPVRRRRRDGAAARPRGRGGVRSRSSCAPRTAATTRGRGRGSGRTSTLPLVPPSRSSVGVRQLAQICCKAGSAEPFSRHCLEAESSVVHPGVAQDRVEQHHASRCSRDVRGRCPVQRSACADRVANSSRNREVFP
jgi:hypothetical protein